MTWLIVDLEDGAAVEVGVIGKEGFSGGAALMGYEDASPLTSMIQIPGIGVWIVAGIQSRG